MAYQPPRSPASSFQQHQSGFFGDGGGMGSASSSNMVVQMGLSYGQNILSQGLQRGEQTFTSSYLPVVAKLQRYFCVDNSYVRKKLGMLMCPFFRKFPPTAPSADSSAGAGGDDGSTYSPMFGSPTTADYPSGPNTPGLAGAGGHKQTSIKPLPTQDCLSFDLYIPLMSTITYVIISAFLFGLVHKGSVKSDQLLSTTSVVSFWLVLEVVVLTLLAYVLHVVQGADLLDVVSLCGYKYPLICLSVLLRQVSGVDSHVMYLPLVVYAAASVGFFTVRALVRFSTREDGRIPPRARLFAYISALVQIPGVLWLCYRPFI